MAEGRTWSSSFPISALLVQPGQYGAGPQSPHTGNIQFFTLPLVSSNTQAGFTRAWHPIPPATPDPSSAHSPSCAPTEQCSSDAKIFTKRDLHFLLLPATAQTIFALIAFIQLTPHKRQPLVLTLKLMSSSHASSLCFLPVSCAEVPACLPRAYLTYYTCPAHWASQWHNEGGQVWLRFVSLWKPVSWSLPSKLCSSLQGSMSVLWEAQRSSPLCLVTIKWGWF